MPARRHTLVLLLLLAGAGLASALMAAGVGTPAPLAAGLAPAALGVGALPPVADRVGRLLGRVRGLTPAARRRVTLGVWVVATLYLAATAWFHARDLFPRVHDEQSYVIGARMLARGRLWMAVHPLADFFDSFHLLVRPVYASIYFPGTALMNVPGVWLGLPGWALPVAAAGAVVALAYRVTAETVDDVAGLLAALIVVSTGRFRTLSTMVMAQVPAALLGMAVVWAWLRWRKGRRIGWAVAVGALAGWAAVTRPVDALAFTLPVALAMALELLRPEAEADMGREGARASAGTWARTAAALAAGAAPFLALQLVFDLRVTGRPLGTPYTFYLEHNQPGSQFGSVPELPATQPTTRPATRPTIQPEADARAGPALPQKRLYYQWLVEDERAARATGWRHWLGARLSMAAGNGLPGAALVALLPVALAGLGRRRRWAVAAAVPLFLGLYLFNPFFLPHYVVPLTAPLAFGVAVAVHTLAAAPGSPRVRKILESSLTLGVLTLCATSLPELDSRYAGDPHRIDDEAYHLPTVTLAEGPLREAVQAPAVLLFRYHPGLSPDDEPVYNSDVVWPDDAAVIRAHDLGERDADLIRYYGSRQPARRFYLFDRGDNALYDLGAAPQALQYLAPGGRLPPPVRKFGAAG